MAKLGGFIIPKPPSTNVLYRNKGAAGRVKTSAYTKWIDAASLYIRNGSYREVNGARVRISIICPAKRNKNGSLSKVNRDCSNLIKPIEDLFVRVGFLEDDSYPFVMEVSSRWDDRMPDNGTCMVLISEYK